VVATKAAKVGRAEVNFMVSDCIVEKRVDIEQMLGYDVVDVERRLCQGVVFERK